MLAQKLDDIQEQAGLGEIPDSLGVVISSALPYLIYIGGFLLLVYLILGGFQIMFSRGDPKAVQGGWNKVTNALIGFVIIILAFTITGLLGKIFKIQIFDLIFGLKGGPKNYVKF